MKKMKKTLIAMSLLVGSYAQADIVEYPAWQSLVTGAENYHLQTIEGYHLKTREGAINDANLLEKQLNPQKWLMGSKSTTTLLTNSGASHLMISSWWKYQIENITEPRIYKMYDYKPLRDTIFFSYSGVGNNNNLTLVNYKYVTALEMANWFEQATDKGANVFVVLDTCTDIDKLLEMQKNEFSGRLFVAKPATCLDVIVKEFDGKKQGLTSYLVAQIFQKNALNKDGKFIRTAEEVKKYLAEEGKKHNVNIILWGIGEYNKGTKIIPEKSTFYPNKLDKNKQSE